MAQWRTVSLQGCPREVRGLLAGEYYHDVDMVNSLPNVAKQLHKLGMTSEARRGLRHASAGVANAAVRRAAEALWPPATLAVYYAI